MILDEKITHAGMRLIRLLIGSKPLTVADLVKATGVTRTAITEQLNELLGAGMIVREVKKNSGRGRPRHVYTVTEKSHLLVPHHRQQIVPAMIEAVTALGGKEMIDAVFDRVSQSLADRYLKKMDLSHGSDTRESRFQQFQALLKEEGIMVEVDTENGHLTLKERSCPFVEMLDGSRTACDIECEMMSKVVGAPVVLSNCRLDGAPCCHFEIVPLGE